MSRHAAAGSAMCTSSAEAVGLAEDGRAGPGLGLGLDGRAGPVSVRTPPSTTIPPLAGSSTAE
eukprot:scaffold71521_cov42-Phaeocystis_antarctica.AAC.2